MRSRFACSALLALASALAVAGLTGCGTLRGWAQGGAGHSSTAGASVSVPLGK